MYSGQYEIQAKLGLVNYIVKRLPKGQDMVVHVDRLRPWNTIELRPKNVSGQVAEASTAIDEPFRQSERKQSSVE